VAEGHALLAPEATLKVISRLVEATAPTPAPPRIDTTLTPRELEVLELIGRGMNNSELASHLVVSDSTIKTHVSRILWKLGLRDRVQAVILAYEAGIVRPGDAG
jgi:DNA-binding NarL/FixJ family response regulator